MGNMELNNPNPTQEPSSTWLSNLLEEVYNRGYNECDGFKQKGLLSDFLYSKKQAIQAEILKAEKRGEGRGRYLTASMIMMKHACYLSAHATQGLPEMTTKVIKELQNTIEMELDKNEKFMRPQKLEADLNKMNRGE